MANGKFLAVAIASAAILAGGPAAAEGDPAAGKKLFKKHQCFVCHKLEPGKKAVGPSLAGMWGREAAAVDGFKYSEALKESGIVWNEETLDPWITDPKKMIKGSKMILAKPVKDEGDRKNLIAYLKEATSQ
jgi:cytochrome c